MLCSLESKQIDGRFPMLSHKWNLDLIQLSTLYGQKWIIDFQIEFACEDKNTQFMPQRCIFLRFYDRDRATQ